ncbi:MAG: YafY family transcriptional regulator [Chloracidobacterium sp.]|nr:YafY family transcriptional regulator [Chloracidobacterium sp.]
MNRTDRLLAIVLELQRKGSRRAEDLAATFETSKRTIYRDIQALCESGVPVVSRTGVGYSLLEGYFLPPVSLSADEATMLLLGGDFAARNFDAQYREAAASAGRKIEAVLSEKHRGEVEYLRGSIAFVAPATLASGEAASFLPQLRRAIIERRTISFGYHTRYSQDGRAARNMREADPYAMLHYGYAWYLIGHCHLRREIRNFRLDRMTGLRLLDKTFNRPSNFKLEEPVNDLRNLKVVALFSPDAAPWVRESRSYYVDSMEDVADGLLVTMRVRVENEVLQWLFSWGSQVRVLEPESLRQRLITEAGKLLENYTAEKLLT